MSRSARLPQGKKGWHVYILRCRDGTLCTGIAVDVSKRLEAHRSGAGRIAISEFVRSESGSR